jgi:hypothetical protein
MMILTEWLYLPNPPNSRTDFKVLFVSACYHSMIHEYKVRLCGTKTEIAILQSDVHKVSILTPRFSN